MSDHKLNTNVSVTHGSPDTDSEQRGENSPNVANASVGLPDMSFTVYNAILRSADAICPGVTSRVSAGDCNAIISAVLNTIGASSQKRCPRIDPPITMVSEILKAVKTAQSISAPCAVGPIRVQPKAAKPPSSRKAPAAFVQQKTSPKKAPKQEVKGDKSEKSPTVLRARMCTKAMRSLTSNQCLMRDINESVKLNPTRDTIMSFISKKTDEEVLEYNSLKPHDKPPVLKWIGFLDDDNLRPGKTWTGMTAIEDYLGTVSQRQEKLRAAIADKSLSCEVHDKADDKNHLITITAPVDSIKTIPDLVFALVDSVKSSPEAQIAIFGRDGAVNVFVNVHLVPMDRSMGRIKLEGRFSSVNVKGESVVQKLSNNLHYSVSIDNCERFRIDLFRELALIHAYEMPKSLQCFLQSSRKAEVKKPVVAEKAGASSSGKKKLTTPPQTAKGAAAKVEDKPSTSNASRALPSKTGKKLSSSPVKPK